jgi:hypothetical protein
VNRLVVVGLVLASATAAAAEWSMRPPDGWVVDDGAAAAACAEVTGLRWVRTAEAVAYRGPADALVTVQAVVVAPETDEAAVTKIEAIEGALAAAERTVRTARSDRIDDQIVIARELEVVKLRVWVRRIYAPARDGTIHAVIAMCAVAERPCAAALDTLALRLPADLAAELETDLGLVVRGIIGLAIVGFGGLLALKLRRRVAEL